MKRLIVVMLGLVFAACGGPTGATTPVPRATAVPTLQFATLAPNEMPETPRPTVLPPPTPTPEPTENPLFFANIELTGKGTKVVKFTKPADVPAIVTISEKGTSNFVVYNLDASGDKIDLLVNEIGNYKGTVLIDADEGEESVAFKVESNGSWTLTVKPLSRARIWAPDGAISGNGDDVLFVFPEPEPFTIVTLKHDGDSNFAIWAYSGDDTDLLVNEIGRYSGDTVVGSDLLLLEITADGSWSITPQA